MLIKNLVTVMIEDNWISVDGKIIRFQNKIIPVEGHEKLWALHWKDNSGEYQFDDPPENFFFTEADYNKYVAPYVLQWEVEKAAQEAEWNKPENVAERARDRRNELLAETDYILMPDYPLAEEQRSAWMAYRQALRDLPEQDGWPMNIVWPEKPNAVA